MQSDISAAKPSSVQWAVRCLWISVALVLAAIVAPFLGVAGIPADSVALITNIISVGLLALVAVKVDAGRDWARWLFAVLYALGSLAFVASLVLVPDLYRSLPAIAKASAITQFLLRSAALVFMFTPASRQWFRARKTVASQAIRT